MSEVKICPACRTEYYAHIECCADCGAQLVWPDENKKVPAKKIQPLENDVGDRAVVRAGSLHWIDELCKVLTDAGIPCGVHADTGCGKGSCGDTCRLLVSPEHLAEAHELIEQYCMKIHPEIKASRELISQGKCPACGSPVDSEAAECPDCGLPLVIVEG